MTKLKSHLLWIRCNVFLKQTLDYRLNGKYLMDIFTEWLYYQPFVNRITKYLQRLQGRIYFLFHGEKSFMRVWGLAEVWAKESNVLQGIRVQNTVRISWLTKAFKDFFFKTLNRYSVGLDARICVPVDILTHYMTYQQDMHLYNWRKKSKYDV